MRGRDEKRTLPREDCKKLALPARRADSGAGPCMSKERVLPSLLVSTVRSASKPSTLTGTDLPTDMVATSKVTLPSTGSTSVCPETVCAKERKRGTWWW